MLKSSGTLVAEMMRIDEDIDQDLFVAMVIAVAVVLTGLAVAAVDQAVNVYEN